MNHKQILAFSLPIFLMVGGLTIANKGGDSSSDPSENLLLLAKKMQRLEAAPPGFKSKEDQELEKAAPKGKPPAVTKRPSKQQLLEMIKGKNAKKAAMVENAKKGKPSGNLRGAAPKDFKSKEDIELEKGDFKGKKPPITPRPQAMGWDTVPISSEEEAPSVVSLFPPKTEFGPRLKFGTEALLSLLNPFAVPEAHAQSTLSISLTPKVSYQSGSYIRMYGGYLNSGVWYFSQTSSPYFGHSNIHPYIYLRLYVTANGFYTLNYRY